jgi:hypothetical protein
MCLIYDSYEHEHETIKSLIINPNAFQLYYRSCGLMVLMKNYDVYVAREYCIMECVGSKPLCLMSNLGEPNRVSQFF